MRFAAPIHAFLISTLGPYALVAAPGITAPSATIGRNLQVAANIMLAEPAPAEGLQLSLKSDDPSRLLLSAACDKRGSASISIPVLPRYTVSADFWLQGVADSGAVTYTVSAGGAVTAKGTITLAKSGIVIAGPFKAPRFPTTPRAEPSQITVASVALDSSSKILEEQQLAGGSQLEVAITSSNAAAGKLSKVPKLAGGSSRAVTYFQPAAEGDTTLVPIPPAGFAAAAEFASVVASVTKPGLAIVGGFWLGKDLQVPATLCLGEAAPEGGLNVTLTSADPSKLVISTREDQLGSGSITITVPPGQLIAQYYLQSLADSGVVAYEGTAPGFRNRTAKIGLAPSGVIVAYSHYGPPDEAAVLRKEGTKEDREFFVSLAAAKDPVHVVAWTVYLEPESRRAADLTVQPLRPGVDLTVNLKSSKPEIGTVESPLIIRSGTNHAAGKFTALKKGTTIVSIDTPSGFSTPRNATSVPAIITE